MFFELGGGNGGTAAMESPEQAMIWFSLSQTRVMDSISSLAASRWKYRGLPILDIS